MKQLSKLVFLLFVMPLCVIAAEEKQEEAQTQALKSVAKEGETFSLRYVFNADENKSVVSDATVSITNQIGAMSMPMKMQTHAVMEFKAASKDEDGGAAFDLSLKSIDGDIEVMGQTQKMPSQMIVNREGTINISALGEIVGGDALTPAMFGPSGPGVSTMASAYFIAFPIKEVSVGESWTLEEDVPVPGSQQTMKMTMKSTLIDIVEKNGEKVAVINSKMDKIGKDIEIDASSLLSKGIPLPPQAAKITLSESTQIRDVTAHFSLDRGCVIWIQDNNEMLTVIGGIGGANQSIRTEMNSEGVMRLEE